MHNHSSGKLVSKANGRKQALMYAVKNGHSPVAAYLLRIGVDPNAADTSGNTPAHYAAAFGWLHCLQLLIKAGADPNSANTWKVAQKIFKVELQVDRGRKGGGG